MATPDKQQIDPKEQKSLDLQLVREAKNGATQKALALLAAGADPEADHGLAHNALAAAIYHGRNSTAEALIKQGAKPCDDAMAAAIHRGNALILRKLIDAGASPNGPIQSLPALSEACRWGKHEAAETLIKAGADPNACGPHNMTALHWAAKAGCAGIRCAAALLQNGASACATDDQGKTPRQTAAEALAQFSGPNDLADGFISLLLAAEEKEKLDTDTSPGKNPRTGTRI